MRTIPRKICAVVAAVLVAGAGAIAQPEPPAAQAGTTGYTLWANRYLSSAAEWYYSYPSSVNGIAGSNFYDSIVFWSLSGKFHFYHRWVDNAHSASNNSSGSTWEGQRYEGGSGWARLRRLGTNFRKGAKILAAYKKRLSSDPNGWFDGQAWFES